MKQKQHQHDSDIDFEIVLYCIWFIVIDDHLRSYLLFTDIDECESEPCQNNGNCTDLLDAFECTCAPGYTNTTCSASKMNQSLFC